MPKMKTHRGAAKRFRVTGSGKIKRRKAFRRHLMSNRTMDQKRGLRGQGYVDPVDEKPVHRLLPYGTS